MQWLGRVETEIGSRIMFMTTHWTVVFQAAVEKSGAGRPALSEIIRKYWKPLYFFARQRGLSPSDAEDATQGFLAGFMDGKLLEQVDPAKGKFRTYLLAAWKRYLIDLYRHDSRKKRGGAVEFSSYDSADCEREWLQRSSNDAQPELVFMTSWASSLVEETLRRLRSEYASSKRLATFEAMIPYLTCPLNAESYQQIASKLSVTAGASKVALHRLRQRFGQCIREVVQETVDDPADIETELGDLLNVLVENPILPSRL